MFNSTETQLNEKVKDNNSLKEEIERLAHELAQCQIEANDLREKFQAKENEKLLMKSLKDTYLEPGRSNK